MLKVNTLMQTLGFEREGQQKEGQVWEGKRCSCGSCLTYDDGFGYTCIDCGRWKAGGSGYIRRNSE